MYMYVLVYFIVHVRKYENKYQGNTTQVRVHVQGITKSY